jgi:DNA-binding response OmpR family regulator
MSLETSTRTSDGGDFAAVAHRTATSHADEPRGEHQERCGANAIRFRSYRVLPGARLLLRGEQPIGIGGRAFDLLMVLLISRGTVVTKAEIAEHVWPTTTVDEGNLRFQVTELRKALGGDRDLIKTVPGRGYLLAAEVAAVSSSITSPSGTEQSDSASHIKDDAIPSLPRGDSSRVNSIRTDDHGAVVIIEDDQGTREALDGLLRSAGLRVETFGSVRTYLERARPEAPGCLVLDAWLPGRSGLDFQSDLSRSDPHVPVIFISGHADVHMAVRAMKAGATEFLTKPVRHRDLLHAIKLALAVPRPRCS